MDRGSRDNQVVRPDQLTGLGELRPEAGVGACEGGSKGHDFQMEENFLEPAAAAAGTGGIGLDFEAEAEFGKSDRTGGDRLGRSRAEPVGKRELRALVGDQQRTVEDQAHGFLPGLRELRPLRTAAASTRRSVAESSTAESWSASS